MATKIKPKATTKKQVAVKAKIAAKATKPRVKRSAAKKTKAKKAVETKIEITKTVGKKALAKQSAINAPRSKGQGNPSIKANPDAVSKRKKSILGELNGGKPKKGKRAGGNLSAGEQNSESQTAESLDGPVIDSVDASVKKLIETGKERGFVTYDDLNKALPPDDVSSEQIEDTMTQLSELGINVVDNEETDDGGAEEGKAVTSSKSANEENQDLGRTDDPVRMYLREMGSVELLSREGEIAIAKRIEAGREK